MKVSVNYHHNMRTQQLSMKSLRINKKNFKANMTHCKMQWINGAQHLKMKKLRSPKRKLNKNQKKQRKNQKKERKLIYLQTMNKKVYFQRKRKKNLRRKLIYFLILPLLQPMIMKFRMNKILYGSLKLQLIQMTCKLSYRLQIKRQKNKCHQYLKKQLKKKKQMKKKKNHLFLVKRKKPQAYSDRKSPQKSPNKKLTYLVQKILQKKNQKRPIYSVSKLLTKHQKKKLKNKKKKSINYRTHQQFLLMIMKFKMNKIHYGNLLLLKTQVICKISFQH